MNLHETYERGQLSKEDLKFLEDNGFFVWQQNSEYTDLDTEVKFEEDENGDYSSFNCNLTFCWDVKSLYLNLGYNLGDGFIEGASIKFENNALIITEISPKFKDLTKHYPNEYDLLVKQVENTLKLINS